MSWVARSMSSAASSNFPCSAQATPRARWNSQPPDPRSSASSYAATASGHLPRPASALPRPYQTAGSVAPAVDGPPVIPLGLGPPTQLLEGAAAAGEEDGVARPDSDQPVEVPHGGGPFAPRLAAAGLAAVHGKGRLRGRTRPLARVAFVVRPPAGGHVERHGAARVIDPPAAQHVGLSLKVVEGPLVRRQDQAADPDPLPAHHVAADEDHRSPVGGEAHDLHRAGQRRGEADRVAREGIPNPGLALVRLIAGTEADRDQQPPVGAERDVRRPLRQPDGRQERLAGHGPDARLAPAATLHPDGETAAVRAEGRAVRPQFGERGDEVPRRRVNQPAAREQKAAVQAEDLRFIHVPRQGRRRRRARLRVPQPGLRGDHADPGLARRQQALPLGVELQARHSALVRQGWSGGLARLGVA